jgi:hypothetical protein
VLILARRMGLCAAGRKKKPSGYFLSNLMIVHFFLFFLKKSARQAGVRFFSSRMIGFLDENKKKIP